MYINPGKFIVAQFVHNLYIAFRLFVLLYTLPVAHADAVDLTPCSPHTMSQQGEPL